MIGSWHHPLLIDWCLKIRLPSVCSSLRIHLVMYSCNFDVNLQLMSDTLRLAELNFRHHMSMFSKLYLDGQVKFEAMA